MTACYNVHAACFDYFYIVGPAQDTNTPRILAHVPRSVPGNKWDNEAHLGILSLPLGCREATESSSRSCHSFIWKKEDGSFSWVHSMEFWNPSGGLSHALAFISRRPLIICSHKILNLVYDLVFTSGLPLESLQQLLNNVFALKESSSITSFQVNNIDSIIIPPRYSPSISLYKTFEKVPIVKVVKILCSLLLERQVAILSSNLEELALLTETLKLLLFPFPMPDTYIPLLPTVAGSESYLEAPIPYVMGIFSPSMTPGFLANLLLESSGRTVFDLDDGTLIVDETLPRFPLEDQVIDLVRSRFNTINKTELERLKKRENSFSLHGKSMPDEKEDSLDEEHNASLSLPFRVAFAFIFAGYENFVINTNDSSDVLRSHETSSVFDKVAFLSEQPESHMQFLSNFLESQAFAEYMKEKIRLEDLGRDSSLPSANHVIKFEHMIYRIRESHAVTDGSGELPLSELVAREPFFEPKVRKQQLQIELNDTPSTEFPSLYSAELFHLLQINSALIADDGITPTPGNMPMADPFAKLNMDGPEDNNANPELMVQEHVKFIERIVSDVNKLVKRILLGRLGRETATEWGHEIKNSHQTEENVQIGQLCELLERIFRHGSKSKRSQSGLWSFLLSFREYAPPETPSTITHEEGQGVLRTFAKKLAGLEYTRDIKPVVKSPVADMNTVLKMTGIQSDKGRVRAWLRLAIEKRLLSHHLSCVTSNPVIVNEHYKTYGLIQCRDKWEQCLNYFLTLGKTQDVEFNCFTDGFPGASIKYRVWIFPGQSLIGISETTANIYVKLVGERDETSKIPIYNKTTLEVEFESHNLGRLVVLAIGHDNSGMFPAWKVKNVLVRNEVTGAFWDFPCGKPIGRSVGDGALERVLMAERLGLRMSKERKVVSVSSRQSLPGAPKEKTRDDLQKNFHLTVNKIQVLLNLERPQAQAINGLLCGENGLVENFSDIFIHEMKTSRMRTNFAWDSIYHTSTRILADPIHSGDPENRQKFLDVFNQVQNKCSDGGKEGKFQTFICVVLRDKIMSQFMSVVRDCCGDLYSPNAFLYEQSTVIFLEDMLSFLATDKVLAIDESLTKGITKVELRTPELTTYESPIFETMPESSV